MADRLTDVELAAIRERADAATPGPWRGPTLEWVHDPGNEGHTAYFVEIDDVERFDPIARDAIEEDAEFIAHARTDVPALLAEVERLRADLDAAHEHTAYHLRDFRPLADGNMTGDLAVDMAAYSGRLKARLDAVLALHKVARDDEDALRAGDCAECWDGWPCPTVKAARGEES